MEFLWNILIYTIVNGQSDKISDAALKKLISSDSVLPNTRVCLNDNGEFWAELEMFKKYIILRIFQRTDEKRCGHSHTVVGKIVLKYEGKLPRIIHTFWDNCQSFENDEFCGEFPKFFALFVFEETTVQVIFNTHRFTELVSSFNFDHRFLKATANGQCCKDGQFFCRSREVLQRPTLLQSMVCQNGDEENFWMSFIKVFTDSSGEYLYFWILSVKYCEETQEFKPEYLYISFRTGFGIVPQDFGLIFDDHYFRLHFAIVIDGNTYPVSFHLDSFENASFEHHQDAFVQSVFSRDGCSYYCGEDTSRYDHIQRIARLEIEIPEFDPPEEESELNEYLKTLPRSIGQFLQRLTWRQLPQ